MTRSMFSTVFSAGVLICGFASQPALATAALNTCNVSNECRARILTLYSLGDDMFVVLESHLLPSSCTAAQWGYYWKLPLATAGDRARYALLQQAYATGEAIELMASGSNCTVARVGIGE